MLAAYARWQPWEAERKRVDLLAGDDPAYDARFDAYTDHWHDGMRAVMALPARTPDGLNAKARVLRALLENHLGAFGRKIILDEASPSEDFAWSLVTDMLGRAGA